MSESKPSNGNSKSAAYAIELRTHQCCLYVQVASLGEYPAYAAAYAQIKNSINRKGQRPGPGKDAQTNTAADVLTDENIALQDLLKQVQLLLHDLTRAGGGARPVPPGPEVLAVAVGKLSTLSLINLHPLFSSSISTAETRLCQVAVRPLNLMWYEEVIVGPLTDLTAQPVSSSCKMRVRYIY